MISPSERILLLHIQRIAMLDDRKHALEAQETLARYHCSRQLHERSKTTENVK